MIGRLGRRLSVLAIGQQLVEGAKRAAEAKGAEHRAADLEGGSDVARSTIRRGT